MITQDAINLVARAIRLAEISATRALTNDETDVIEAGLAVGGKLGTEVHNAVKRASSIRDKQALDKALADLGSDGGPASGDGFADNAVPGGLFGAISAAGWSLGGPGVTVPFGAVLIADPADAAPVRGTTIIPQGTDNRRLYPALGVRPLDGATSIEELISSGRDLAEPTEMQIALAGTSEKPVTSSGATLQTFEPVMIASVTPDYPNALVEKRAFRDLINDDLSVAYNDSFDILVTNELATSAGNTDDAGSDLFEQLRKAVTVIQGEGFNPTLAAVSPTDAETLDLSRSGGSTTGDGPFILSPAPRGTAFDPLWNLRIRVVKNLAAPIVLDPSTVRVYADNPRFDADPYTGFSTNESRFRLEGPALCVVRQPGGIYVVAAGSGSGS
jgi:hypothetical protein